MRAPTASRLGVDSPGLPIARTVAGGRTVQGSWEAVSVDIWGQMMADLFAASAHEPGARTDAFFDSAARDLLAGLLLAAALDNRSLTQMNL